MKSEQVLEKPDQALPPSADKLSERLSRSTERISESVHRYACLYALAFAVMGITLDDALYASLTGSIAWWTSIAALAIALPSGIRLLAMRGGRMPLIQLTANGVLVACFFGCWHAWDETAFRSAGILRWTEQGDRPVVVRGRLVATPSVQPSPFFHARDQDGVPNWQTRLTVSLDSIRSTDSFVPTSGRVRVFVDGDLSARRPGERLEIYGWIQAARGPTNPGQPDLRGNDRHRRIHARLSTKNASAITVLESSPWSVLPAIAWIAGRGREALFRHTDADTGPLAIALVIGQREFVRGEVRDALLATGTAHLLSVSGMHLAIIVLVVTAIASALGLRTTSRLLLVVSISVVYVLVTGGRPPVVRAAILVGMWFLSTCLRRTSQAPNTLAVAGLILLLFNPLNVFAVGVHLSFLAVFTLMFAGQMIATQASRLDRETQREANFDSLVEKASSPIWIVLRSIGRFLIQLAWMSSCVTAISFPLVWHQFHLVSPISVLTNVLVWFGLMIALPSGVFVVLLDPISTTLAAIPGAICNGSLNYMWWVIRWTESWPIGHAWLPAPPTFMIVAFYVVIAATLFWRTPRARSLRRAWIVVWGLAALWLALQGNRVPEGELEATFVDVGHGTSVILRDAHDHVWLYDCGSMGNDIGSSRNIDTSLWRLGVTHLDGIFLSHADADHFNALPALLRRFEVDRIITPPGMLRTDEPAIVDLSRTIARREVPVIELASGARVATGSPLALRILHPPEQPIAGSDNAKSLVLSADLGKAKLILPGDLEPPGTQILTSQVRPAPGSVLMAPHHGSLTMDAETILAWSRPGQTVVSGGDRARKPEVAQMLSITGSGVHVTAISGAIRVRIDRSGKIDIRRWLEDPW